MSWSAPGAPGNVVSALQTLANYLGRMERTLPVTDPAKVLTTDATATVLLEIEVPVNETMRIEGCVVARRTGGVAGSANDGASYTVKITAKNTAGTAAAIGSTITADGESQAGWDVTVAASGNKIQIKVTGSANNTVAFVGHFKTLSVGT